MKSTIWMRATTAAALVVLSSGPGGAAFGLQIDGEQPPGPVTISVESTEGSGCPKSATTAALSPDRQALTLTFGGYTVQSTDLGPGGQPVAKRCKVQLVLNVPAGYTQAVVQADFRGFARLTPGTSGWLQAKYFTQGTSEELVKYSALKGPHDDAFSFSDHIPLNQVVWSECGKSSKFGINTAIQLEPSEGLRLGQDQGHSMITMDSADVSTKTRLKVVWRRC